MRSYSAVVVLLVLAGCDERSETRSNANAVVTNHVAAIDSDDVTPDEIDAWPTIAAADLSAAFQKNEAAALLFYSGRPLKVSGVVKNIDMTFGDPVIILRGTDAYGMGISKAGKFTDVRLSGLTTEQAAAIEQGQAFTFLCHDVSVMVGSPHLARCVPVSDPKGDQVREP